MLLYHNSCYIASSLVFSLFNTELKGITNQVGLFGKSLNNIGRDFKTGQGLRFALFGSDNVVTQYDVTCVKNLVSQLNSGVPVGEAWRSTMSNANKAGREWAVAIRRGTKSLSEMEAEAKTAQSGINGLAFAQTALNIAISVGLAVAIPALIKGFDNLAHARKKAYEAAQEESSKAKSELKNAETEANKLDELIQKYKELAESDTSDVNTRKQIRDIQDNITELVGQQANNLDLVNGKLDEQIAKLNKIRGIEAQDALDKANVAYHEAAEAEKSAIGSKSIGGIDGFVYGINDSKTVAQDEALLGWLNSHGHSKNVPRTQQGNFRFITDWHNSDGSVTRNAKEKAEVIQGMIDDIKNNYKGNYIETDLYNALITQRDTYKAIVSNTDVQLKSVIDKTLIVSEYDSELSQMTVNSAETFDKYRNALINKVKSNDNVLGALAEGRITDEDISTNVDSYLNTISNLSTFYNEWKNWQTDIEKMTPILENLKSTGASKSKVNELSDWITNLSNSDKNIVYKISAEYSSEDVKEKLEKYAEGGTVDLTLRPKVDGKELEKAGWGNVGDYGTVLTHTASNEDGTIAINFTPIVVDENGKYVETLSPEAIQQYGEDVIRGARIDDLKLQIGTEFTGQDAIQQAVSVAKEIHLLQDYYYNLGDPSKFNLEKWQNALESYKNTYADTESKFAFLLSNKGTEKNPEFIDRIDKYVEKINNLNEALEKYRKGNFSNSDFDKLIRKFPQLATRSKDLDIAINELKSDLVGDVNTEFNIQMNNMVTEEDKQSLLAFQSAMNEIAQLEDGETINLTAETTSLTDFNTAIKESASATGLSAEAITKLNARYKALEGHETKISELYVETSTGIHLNVKALRELEKAYNSQKQNGQILRLESLKNKYKELTNEMRKTTDVQKYAQLYNERSGIAKQIDETSALISQYEALTSKYNAWQAAMTSDNPSDPYSNIQSGYEKIGKLIEQGWAYKDEVDTYLDLLLNPDVRTKDNISDYEKLSKQIKGTGFSVKDFFITDDDGNLVTDGVFNFFDAINKGLGTEYVKILSDGTYWWDLTGNKAEKVAEYLGVSNEFVDWMQQAMKDITHDFTEESMFSNFNLDEKDVEKSLISLSEKMKDVAGKYKITDIFLNSDNLTSVNNYIENISNLIKDNFMDGDGKIDFNISGAEDASVVLAALIQQKAELTAPAVMTIDTESLENVDIQVKNAITLLQNFINLSAQLDAQKSLGLDTTNTQTQIVNVATSLSDLPAEIKTKIGIDDKDVSAAISGISKTKISAGVKLKDKDIKSIQEAIAGIDTKKVQLLTNSADIVEDLNQVEKFKIHKKSFNVEMKGYQDAMNSLKNLDVFSFSPKTITVNTVYNDSGGTGKAQGTAHARGTAFVWGSAYRSGDWGVKKEEDALAGEVAPEIVVRDGHFFTIGEDGAEFFHFKKNDIVFNAEQSRQLLENGKIANGKKRGVTYANGTAYEGGSTGTAKRRTITPKQQEEQTTTQQNSSSSTPSVDSVIDSNVSNDSTKYIDRVAIKLDRLKRKIEDIATTVNNTFTVWTNRNLGISNQITAVTTQINAQHSAAERYLKEANNQIAKYGLASDWVEDIQRGGMAFSYLTNLDELYEGYQEYQKWYEKYLDCLQEEKKLRVELSQLYKDEFDNIKKYSENQISLYQYSRDENEKTYTQSTKYFEDMRKMVGYNLSTRRGELNQLKSSLQKALDRGAVEKYSEAWQEMQTDINGVEKAISELNVEISKSYVDQFNYIQENFKNQLSLFEHESNIYGKEADLIEAQGYLANSKLLVAQRDIQKNNINLLQSELSELEAQLAKAMDDGKIEKYSSAWYSMTTNINGVKESIYNSRIEVQKLGNEIRQLDWDKFDLQRDTVGQVNDEADFLLSLIGYTDLYDKKGRLTDTGLTALGLHNQNATIHKSQAWQVQKELTKNYFALAEDPDNQDLLKRRQELLKMQRESIRNLEDEQKAMVSLAENGIKVELDSLKELINTYSDALDAEKSLYDYQNKISDKTKDIATIQKQLSAYANDSSEEAKANIQKLQVELSNAQKELSETEYEKSIAEQKKLLNGLYDEYEQFLNSRLDDTKALLEDLKNVVNTIPKEIGDVISNIANNVGMPLSQSMIDTWKTASDNIENWNKTHTEDQQITKEAVLSASDSWATFGENLKESVVSAYSDIGEDFVTATSKTADGITGIYNNLESKSNQIIANNDLNSNNIIDEISSNDYSSKIYDTATTANGEIVKIRDLVQDIANETGNRNLGDVDNDGIITSSDSLLVLQASVGKATFDNTQKKLADIDGDGNITAADALAILQKSVGIKSYSSGGLNDYTGIAVLHGTKTKPEIILNAKDSQNFLSLRDVLRNKAANQSIDILGNGYNITPPKFAGLSNIPNVISGMTNPNISQNTTVNLGGISIDHVEDYNDLISQMQKDKNFEKLIRAMTIDQTVGKNSFAKYNYKW